jgi:hypothetical protein
MHAIPCRRQPVDQPIPVVGRLDDDAGKLASVWLEPPRDNLQRVRQSAFRHHPVALVENSYDAVVGMQVDPAIQCHLGLLDVWVGYFSSLASRSVFQLEGAA